MLTKTANGETTEFEYNNEWLDQLTSVNGVSLTYDIMGNLLTYGDAEYTWSRGRLLDSITDGENSYSYTYDTNGVRTSKKVNGYTTNFNVLDSKILAQESIDGYMYFQYSGDELIGFHLNDAQYFYIKNLNGDIVGIEDYDGNLIAQYEYDEWGKLLNITTAEEGSEEQLRIANANPFRYRSYYYDNETGYYYLQSRYYNPEWGRFISADDLTYINNTRLTRNAYIYCINNPIKYIDPFGNEEKEAGWVSDLGKQVVQIIFTVIFVDGILTLINETSTLAYNMISNFIAANVDLAANMAIAFTAMVSMFWNEYVVPFNDKVIDTLQDLFFEMFDWLYKTATGAFNSVFGFIDDSFNTISDVLFTDLQNLFRYLYTDFI